MLFRLGIRLRWLNREEHLGWASGVNVSRIVKNSALYLSPELLQGGDVVVAANQWPSGYDAHVVCVIDQPNQNALLTAESGLPGNGLQTRALPLRRRIRTVLRLAEVLEESERTGSLDETVPAGPSI